MKKLLSFFLTITILLAAIPSFTIAVSADSLYIRKVVSIVMDDSTSMRGAKWAYANYALQVFCGMLNSEDQLYVTYMSEAEESNLIDLSENGIQDSIDSIKDRTVVDTTPFTSVETAFETLKGVNDTDPNTQYWLVVITDGVFDEIQGSSADAKKDFLNEAFDGYTSELMDNGSTPQVMFLSIGNSVTSPDEDKEKGILTYSAKNASGIIDTMSEMADMISGRTRLESGDISLSDDKKTITASSPIPLLNIVCFVQGSTAEIESVSYMAGSGEIGISREADLSYSDDYPDLVGSAYLLTDETEEMIVAGTYTITFDSEVSLDDVDILYEPALEVKLTYTLDGEEVTASDLENASAGSIISVSYKVCEMGTDNEVSSSLLPSGTDFRLSISVNDVEVRSVSNEMTISDYELTQEETKITASVTIEGFNPITSSVKFTPTEPIPSVVYSVVASYGDSSVTGVKHDYISDNSDLTICFNIYEKTDDEEPVLLNTEEAVSALNPIITASPDGNSGKTEISSDGTIIFTPDTASDASDNFKVTVTCTLSDGTSESLEYDVILSDYMVVATDADESVRKTGFFGNQVSVSFEIYKDNQKLGKQAVEEYVMSVTLNEEQSGLGTDIDVADDGTIIVTPYSQEEHKLNFFSWWTNWAYYFSLSGKDVTIKLNHSLVPASQVSGTIDVTGESVVYLILNVFLPLGLEILILALIIAYIVRYFTKARFAPNGVLYVGSISRLRGTAGAHAMELHEVRLNQFNKFANLWNPFKELTVSADGVNITAFKGNKICCNEAFPWYADGIKPKARTLIVETPKDVVNYCIEHDELVIREIKPEKVIDEQTRILSQDDSVYYFVRADIDYVKSGAKQIEVIDSAVAFCYSTIQN